jgi:hypothetical protein
MKVQVSTLNRTHQAPPTRNFLLGMHVTEAGEGVLQTPCGEFDSHRLQVFPFSLSFFSFFTHTHTHTLSHNR